VLIFCQQVIYTYDTVIIRNTITENRPHYYQTQNCIKCVQYFFEFFKKNRSRPGKFVRVKHVLNNPKCSRY